MARPSRSSGKASRSPRRPAASRRQAARGRRRASGRISWSRRLGVVLALLLLGASVVLAGQALERSGLGGAPHVPSNSAPPLPTAPRLLPPANELVASATIDIDLELSEVLRPRSDYQLRVYVNDQLVRERRLPGVEALTLSGIPLEPGENRITAAVAGAAGEGLHSAPILVVRDDVSPTIHISSPGADQQVITRQVLLRGRSEGGALLSVRNTTNGESHELVLADDGRFEQRLSLAMGRNVISLQATDAAGNRSRARLRLMRLESQASLSLEVRPESVRVEDLPTSLTLIASVRGLDGELLNGAEVTFSISVPGQATSTYSVTSSRGVAAWRNLRVPAEGALPGHGLATAMVVLNPGQPEELVLQQSASIRFR